MRHRGTSHINAAEGSTTRGYRGQRARSGGQHRAMERDVVRVRAVVMTRDDSSGGWVPLGGGGLSHVAICKGRSPEDRGRRDYCIRGERLRDRAPVLECLVQRGLVYNKVNPIFHHWRVEDQKFGLTFQSPADAISFEQGLRGVIDRLERESDSPSSSTPEEGDTEDDGQASHTGSESSSNSRKEMLPKPITIVTSESSSPCLTLASAAEDYAYGSQHAVTTQTPAQTREHVAKHRAAKKEAQLAKQGRLGTPVYSNTSSQARAVRRISSHLPKSPRKHQAAIKEIVKHNRVPVSDPVPPTPSKSAHNRVPDEVRSRFTDFYLCQDISWTAPGRKDYIIVIRDGEKVTEQWRYLVMSIREAYNLYKQEFPDDTISLPSFQRLRPDVVLFRDNLFLL
ncbi:hypothetical protein GJAV_G00132420 [Gymnothorax javanicus]|nr:hypothetical protein GJAV_G00132420 [Gymnothorax javanicus]